MKKLAISQHWCKQPNKRTKNKHVYAVKIVCNFFCKTKVHNNQRNCNCNKTKCKVIYRCKKSLFAIHKHCVEKAQNWNVKGNFCKHLHGIKHFEGRNLFCRNIFTANHFSFCNQSCNCEHDKSHQTYSCAKKWYRNVSACKISCYQQCEWYPKNFAYALFWHTIPHFNLVNLIILNKQYFCNQLPLWIYFSTKFLYFFILFYVDYLSSF